jgi:hypothetical protein
MKKSVLLFCLCMLWLMGCGETKPVQTQEGTSAKTTVTADAADAAQTSFNKAMAQSGSIEGMHMTAISSGYIMHLATRLYYTESDSMESTILCALPQCDHDDEDCNAYLSLYGPCVAYAGKLYYIDGLYGDSNDENFGLYAMSYAGDQRTMVAKLDGWTADARNAEVPFALSGDDLIYSPDGQNVYYLSLETGVCEQVYAYDGPAELYTIYEVDGKTVWDQEPLSTIWTMWMDSGTAYFMGTVPQDEYTYRQQLYAYTPGDDAAKLVWEVPETEMTGTWETAGVYVNGWYLDAGVLSYFLSGNGVWQYDFATGTTTCLFQLDADVTGQAAFDGEFVYISTGNDLLIYDYEGDLTGTVSSQSIRELLMEYTLSADAMTVQLLGTDDNRIFLFCEATGVELETDNPDVTLQDTYQVVCSVEKAELSSETPVTAIVWP